MSNSWQESADEIDELSALTQTLNDTLERLELLTAGEVDTVVDRKGRTFLLRRAQHELHQREAVRRGAILDALPAHVALLDDVGVIVTTNQKWRQQAIAGAVHCPGHAVGVDYLGLCEHAVGDGAEDSRKIARGLRSVLERQVSEFSFEYPCNARADTRWFLFTAAELAGERAQGAVITHLETTKRKRVQIALDELSRKSKKRERVLSTTLSAIADFTYIFDRNGCFLFANRSLTGLLGISEQEIVGKNFFDLNYPADLAATFQKQIEAVFTSKQPVKDVTPFTSASGQPGFYEYILSPVMAADGSVEFVAGSTRDISQRMQIEAELRQSKAELTLLTEAMPQIVWITRADGWNLFFNQQWMDYTGLTLAESLGHGWHTRFHPEDQTRAWDAWQNATTTVGTYSVEGRLRRADGEYRWWLVRGVPFKDSKGNVLKWFGTCTDIHSLKTAELEIAANNALLRSNDIKIKRQYRVYAVLSAINTLIVCARSREQLFSKACLIAVEEGQFKMAAIAMVDWRTVQLRPVAWAGGSDDCLAAMQPHLSLRDDDAAGMSVFAMAVNGKQPIVINDVAKDALGKSMQACIDNGVSAVAILPLLVAGESVGVLVLCNAESGIFDAEEVKLLTGLADDIAFAIDHIDKETRLDFIARHDVMTGLANRTQFLERLAEHKRATVAGGHKLALVLIDIERFRSFNESLGRRAGDRLLMEVAERLVLAAGSSSLLARVGADQFVVVLPVVTQHSDIIQFFDKLNTTFHDYRFKVYEAEFKIVAKYGITVFPDDSTVGEVLLNNVEAALNKAKKSGDRYLFYTENMNENTAAKLQLETQLRDALENGEFELHYQPKVELATGKVSSAEALIRWRDPRSGMVPPGQFIPVLEEIGLIHEVGRWVLRKASEDYLRWRSAGFAAVRIAVNVSALQLRSSSFVDEIMKVVGVDPHAAAGLELEITESVIMDDVQGTIARLAAIRDLGVTTAIDDFGTGFSSLGALSKLPVDSLKIDRSFIVDMTTGPDGLALVSTIIKLAHGMKLKVVAEGVETEEQMQLLRLLNCNEMQGFLVSEAVTAEIFAAKFLVADQGN